MKTLTIAQQLRPLGATPLRSFPLAYGCWRFAGTSVRDAREKIAAALEVGINLFDHADIYGGDGAAETLFGAALAEAPELGSRMLVATKGGIVPGVPYDSSAAHLRTAVEGSLRRLRVDAIDLYQIHRPDNLTHPEEIAGVLTRLRREGKIREVGVSNYSATQFEALQHFLDFPIATHQPELSAWRLDSLLDGLLDQCMRCGVTPLAWSPLAGGVLGITRARAERQPHGARLASLIDCLDRLAAREEVSRSAVALAFLLAHPAGIIPIIGTQQPERIRESAAALRVRLTRAPIGTQSSPPHRAYRYHEHVDD